MLSLRRPAGLILAGGGSLGSWQSGFLGRLAGRHGAAFDAALGVSTGALTAAAYALDRLDVLCGFWRDISARRVLRWRPRLFPPTMFGNESLWEIVAHGGCEEEAKARTRLPFTVVATERRTGRRRYARYSPGGAGGWDGPLGPHLVASCSIPDVFPPVALPAPGGTAEFVDGGVGGEPPDFSALAHCRDVVVVEMIRPGEPGLWPGLSPVRWRERRARRGLRRYTERGLETLRALPEPPRLFRAVPSAALDFSLIAFETRFCAPAFARGEADADAFAAEPLLAVERAAPSQGRPRNAIFAGDLSSPPGEPNG